MGYQEMDRKIAEKMVELAIGQLAYSYAPYSGFKVGAALLAENGKFTQAAILKMPLIHRQTVRNGRPFLKQSAMGSGRFVLFVLLEGRMAF